VRRTISVSEAIDRLIKDRVAEEGSYSAAVARLVEAGTRRLGRKSALPYVAAGDGPPDLSIAAERYVRAALRRRT